ncbi:MAG TPA: rhodanese-like domain-containing protein [Candidatus Merdisoma merdipullorum]|nr:rhodanese-like domain-containing protein [Candidatus Merdisoma merdipullorum]
MGFFDFFKTPDINEELKKYQSTPGAVLLDVRTDEEYAEGRIPGSKNIALHELNKIKKAVPDFSTPLFVYCLSGARSRQAVSGLKSMGYTAVTDLGGIHHYHGTIER